MNNTTNYEAGKHLELPVKLFNKCFTKVFVDRSCKDKKH